MPDMSAKIWMSTKEVAEALECSKGFVRILADRGDIQRRQTTAHRRYLRSSVVALMKKQQPTAS